MLSIKYYTFCWSSLVQPLFSPLARVPLLLFTLAILKVLFQSALISNEHIFMAHHIFMASFSGGSEFYENKGHCPFCHRFYASKLRRHIKAVHFGLKPYSCSQCAATFASTGNRKNHEQRTHKYFR